MGVKYLSPEDIKKNKQTINKEMEKSNIFIRQGTVLAKIKSYPQDANILDIGCGRGELAKRLMDSGYHNISLVDIDNYCGLPVSLLDVCFDKLPFADNSFDLVTAIAIFEHLENPHFAFREIHRVLKTGGLFFLAIPNNFSLRSRLTYLFKCDLKSYGLANNHITYFTKAVFAKTLLDKFSLQETVYSPGYVKVLGRSVGTKGLNNYFGDKVLYILNKK